MSCFLMDTSICVRSYQTSYNLLMHVCWPLLSVCIPFVIYTHLAVCISIKCLFITIKCCYKHTFKHIMNTVTLNSNITAANINLVNFKNKFVKFAWYESIYTCEWKGVLCCGSVNLKNEYRNFLIFYSESFSI